MAKQDPEGQLGVESMSALMQNNQTQLVKAAIDRGDLETKEKLIRSVGSTGDSRGSDLMADIVNAKSNDLEIRRHAVRAITKSRQGAMRLLKGVENNRLDPALASVAAAALNRARWGDIREQSRKLFPPPAGKDAEPLPNLGDLARTRGDVGRGQKIFASTGTCAKCHIVNDEGKDVGPNLSEIGDKLSREAMFEAILYPSAGISHNYESYNLVTVDGNQWTGLLRSKTDARVVITSDDGITRTIKSDDIEILQKQRISLMPADLAKLMSKQDLTDVVEYLTSLKKK